MSGGVGWGGVSYYSGRKVLSLKMGSVCFSYYYYYYFLNYFFGGLTSSLMLIGLRPPRDTFAFFKCFSEKKVADHWQRTDSIHINCKRVCTIV